MAETNLTTAYNYAVFSEENVMPWLNFGGSPPLGEAAPDFSLWNLDGTETSLSLILAENRFTAVEFGSFT
jgi:hypothetical protein